ncbi:MAG: tRNA epoxyqueuosine(34) reductase QueG [Pseudomonadota bacterium]
MTSPPVEEIRSALANWAEELGFQSIDFAKPSLAADIEHLNDWLDRGRHAEMAYMANHATLRAQPDKLFAGVQTIISVTANYMPESIRTAERQLSRPEGAYISRYALGRDYHKTIRARLKRLANKLEHLIGPFGFRVFTDSAPVLERALARNAGLGWIGKNTMLINREHGSLFFLGEIYTDLLIEHDQEETKNHCGSCSACLDLCPTSAIVAPYQLDARRCISYLTIENKGPIPIALRSKIGNRIFGCDDCQFVCPWNRYARRTELKDFEVRHQLDTAELTHLIEWDKQTFLRKTEGSAIRRIGHQQWLRNLAVALGNSVSSPTALRALSKLRSHSAELVREHVSWALERLEK